VIITGLFSWVLDVTHLSVCYSVWWWMFLFYLRRNVNNFQLTCYLYKNMYHNEQLMNNKIDYLILKQEWYKINMRRVNKRWFYLAASMAAQLYVRNKYRETEIETEIKRETDTETTATTETIAATETKMTQL